MGNYIADRRASLHVTRSLWPALLGACLVAGCDNGAAGLVREIDAAREGCTEEMLKAADEACIRMFEKYADMAAGAMETYIGGMRAFDEAIQRKGGLQFDTAGLGRAFGDGWRGAGDSIAGAPDSYRQLQGPATASGYAPMPYSYGEDPYGPVAGGRWSDPAPGGAMSAQVYPGANATAGQAPVPDPPARSSSARRGVLLPPEERLRRPWIDDAESDDRYVDEGAARAPARAPNGQPSGWYPYPGAGSGGYPYPGGVATPYPYSGGVPGSYPYGGVSGPYPYGSVPSQYPYGGGVPGSYQYPYPYGEPGAWDPYLMPGPGGYPYADSPRGGR